MTTARSDRVPSRSGSQRNDWTLSIVQRFASGLTRPGTWRGNMLRANSACVAYSPTKR